MHRSIPSLACLECGMCARAIRLGMGPDEARRLRTMGLCEGRLLQVVRTGRHVVVRIGGTRIALDRRLAAEVAVDLAEATVPEESRLTVAV